MFQGYQGQTDNQFDNKKKVHLQARLMIESQDPLI